MSAPSTAARGAALTRSLLITATLAAILAIPLATPVDAQEPESAYPIPNVAVSVNPLGFLQFGPTFNLELGITESLAAAVYARAVRFGVLTSFWHGTDVTTESGLGVAAGALYFGRHRERNKPYLGAFVEYAWSTLFSDFLQETTDHRSYSLILNGGWRFRTESGFFFDMGAYLGAGLTSYETTRPGGGSSGGSWIPAGQLEFSAGIGF